jgi:hypothetical protein
MQPNGKRTNDSTTAPPGNERPTNRVTVADAGRLLGLSAEAVRMRIKRATLASEKVDGTVYVLLDSDQSEPDEDQASDQTGNRTPDLTAEQTELAKILHEQVSYLREQLDQEREANRENRRIIAGLVQRGGPRTGPGNVS